MFYQCNRAWYSISLTGSGALSAASGPNPDRFMLYHPQKAQSFIMTTFMPEAMQQLDITPKLASCVHLSMLCGEVCP